ncbi:MAG: hypothetical protein AB7E37_04355 [Candidatus Altimarinota bacterium]
MIIEVDESFKTDFKKLRNKELEKRIIKKNEDIEKVENIFDISNLKKMKGFDNFYRIIIGVGLIENYFTQNKK